jgi:mannosylfructose-phosphate synthase
MSKKHILMITNHGIHEWDPQPGLPDTGGQNLYVNQLSRTLADMGYRVTIANRGGYPDPRTGEPRTGIRKKDKDQKIVYLEDENDKFVRKEEMKPYIPELRECLHTYLEREGDEIDLIISHYWDGALLGLQLNKVLDNPVPHIWVPHSLGAIKKRNVPEERWADLKIDERIETEKEMIDAFDYTVATSALIRTSLSEDYGREASLFLPPCIRTERFHPRDVPGDNEIWSFLAGISSRSGQKMKEASYIIEISRTDRTKQKGLLIRAFSEVLKRSGRSDLYLILSLGERKKELYGELRDLIESLGIGEQILEIGFEVERLPWLYAVSSVYCSPSIMEGFGMSVQEAAATAVPAVGSRHIPFLTEYLSRPSDEGVAGAIVVEEQEPKAYADALTWMLEHESERKAMGKRALDITIPAFTWEESTKVLLDAIGFRDKR